MTVNQDALSQNEIDKYFVNVALPDPNTFELALVLGGTVSAGAYTAGVVDFLIEALDEWTKLRDGGDVKAPKHKVVLKVITGTSGGGVNAAIAARALACDFPHVVRSTPGTDGDTGNPFYNVWINRLRLAGLLDTSDIDQKSLVSLLNGKPIDDGADYICAFAGNKLGVLRSYIANPLRVILTVTNLRGIPYKTSFGSGLLSETFVDHADYCRFAVVYPNGSLAVPRPDELVLGFENARLPQATDWPTFSLFARATAAFPLGFPPRALVRPTEHYRYRVVVLPSDKPSDLASVVPHVPDWSALIPTGETEVPSDYHFLTVDGGATDNEPIELARTALVGVLGRNPRDGSDANRAVMLIDPFAGQAGLGPDGPATLPSVVEAVVSTFTEQTRYDSQDLLLAADPNVFSRFMITPQRDGKTGGPAIASDGLGAFLGFACPAFMRHDYLLGRANCQAYLRKEFALPVANPIFKGMWTPAQETTHGFTDEHGTQFLPLIPLLGNAAVLEATDPWPKHALDPETYRDAIEKRFKAILEFEGSDGVISSSFSWILAHLGEEKVADFAINAMKKALDDAGLS
jgi:hypothetical protein